MGAYKVYRSSKFEKELKKFDSDFVDKVDKIENKLVNNPFEGDPLKYHWIREKRIRKHRIYYLVYRDLGAVFMVAISGKKDQQKVINTINLMVNFFWEEIKRLVEDRNST